MMMKKLAALSCLFLATALPAQAGQRDMISSCYGLLKIDRPAPALQREIFVIIDQTTPVDAALQKALVDAVTTKLTPQTAVTIVTFSAFIGDHYANLVFSGQLETPPAPAERDDMPKCQLRDLDNCLAQQGQFAKLKTAEAMAAGFGTPSNDIARSDILATLKDVSSNLVANSPAARKDVLLISDMLENSSLTSFYAKNGVKRIDGKAELAKVGGFGNFGGANIYVAGAGTITTQGKRQIDTYRDPKTMEALEAFWRDYFSQSNAKLAAFGKPALLGQF